MNSSSELRGILAMLTATATFVVGDSFMKIALEDLPPYEVLFLRGVACSLVAAMIVTARAEWSAIAGVLNLKTVLRALGETLSTLCYVVALARMPIADVIAILQTAPLILILGAALILRERIGVTRILLVILGFAGALLVAQPGTSGFTPVSLLAFGSAFLIASRDLVGRGVPLHIPVTIVIFCTMIVMTVGAGLMMLAAETWMPPTPRHLTYIGLAGTFIAVGQIGLVLAYRWGRTASVAPFFYSFALWGVLAGLVVWGELPNAVALVGIALIVLSGVIIVIHAQRGVEKLAPAEAL